MPDPASTDRRPLTRERAEELGEVEVRYPYLCECGQGNPPEHVCCSACGDDWGDCECGTLDSVDVPWMLAGLGA